MSVLFVCTGNICRSPAAHAVFAAHAGGLGLPPGDPAVRVDSAGTGAWHAGELPDPRAVREGARRRYRLDHPARQVRGNDFRAFDWIVAMDRSHERALRALAPEGFPQDRIVLLRSFDPAADGPDVADPYYGGDDGFVAMFDAIEAAMPGLLAAVTGDDARAGGRRD